jgi:hypothetical protein
VITAAKPRCSAFSEAGPQTGALAHAGGVAQQHHRQVGDCVRGAVVGTVIDHDHVRAVPQRPLHHVADAQGLR